MSAPPATLGIAEAHVGVHYPRQAEVRDPQDQAPLFPENQKVFRLDVEVRPALPVQSKDPETGLLHQAQHDYHANQTAPAQPPTTLRSELTHM